MRLKDSAELDALIIKTQLAIQKAQDAKQRDSQRYFVMPVALQADFLELMVTVQLFIKKLLVTEKGV